MTSDAEQNGHDGHDHPGGVHEQLADVPAAAGRLMTGRFAPGNRIGAAGRPRAIDIRALAEEKSREEGFDLRTALYRVLRSMIEKAQAGDAAAAKLVLDRLTDTDTLRVQVGHDGAPMADGDMVARVRAIFATAELYD